MFPSKCGGDFCRNMILPVPIHSGESKVHIEVLSVLWGNRLPIPNGSLSLSSLTPLTRSLTGGQPPLTGGGPRWSATVDRRWPPLTATVDRRWPPLTGGPAVTPLTVPEQYEVRCQYEVQTAGSVRGLDFENFRS
ncbi:hypothetical protein Tco_1280495 [Tanacetum coccineum]